MLGYYNYTVVLTYVGMLSSFFGITLAVGGNLWAALLCLMFSGFCDMFDGKVASTMERTPSQKRFGIQIDSLSDLICFGVLPAIIIFELDPANKLAGLVSGLYLLCALIRLAYFNVDEEERQDQTQEARSIYKGLPVTTAALILPGLFCLHGLVHQMKLEFFGPILLVCMGLAFLTPFRLRKPGNLGKVVMIVVGVAELLLLTVGSGI